MKSRSFITASLAIFLFVLISTVTAQDRTTVVFIDKTMSVEQDSLVHENNCQWLRKIVKENVQEAGDKIILSFIFENTSSLANKYEFTYRPPKPQTGRMSSSEARIVKVKYAKRLRSYKKRFSKKILDKAFSSSLTGSSTDVIGTIKLLSDFSKETQQPIKSFYFSDMQECSHFRELACGNRTKKVTTYNQAQLLGKEDYQRVQQRYQLARDCLRQVSEITVIFPAKEMDTNTSYAILPQYWTVLFKSLGVKSITYR